MMRMKRTFSVRLSSLLAFAAIIGSLSGTAEAQTPALELPRLELADFQYQGAFRLSAAEFGESSLNFSEGPVAYNPQHHSLFIAGHSHHQAIAEFAIPALSVGSTLSELTIVAEPRQNFATILQRATGGNPQGLDRIGGLSWFNGSLLVNAYEYYDAPADNTQTTLLLRDAENLAASTVEGFFRFPGAAHAAGWISPVPLPWQGLLGGTHITGNSSGIPIIGRASVGPSAFAFNASDFLNRGNPNDIVATTTLLDFSLTHPLHDDLSNTTKTNALWTHLSRATYGFIVPGTRTYLTLGYSGGHQSGVCYKCEQLNHNVCGGYCAPDPDDNYAYYWLFDLNDLVAVGQGSANSFDVRPYAQGIFPTPFASREIGGGSFDPSSGTLYLTLQRADTAQGQYANPPVVVAYKFVTTPDVPSTRTPGDFDGDGRTDFTVVRPGEYAWWHTLNSQTRLYTTFPWGYSDQDVFLDLDLNGDTMTDHNATRTSAAASVIDWFTLLSPDRLVSFTRWGETGDIPSPGDFDGDGSTDPGVFRPSTGDWWLALSAGGALVEQWGLHGDTPVPADFDGDGKDDLAIWRAVSGFWAVRQSSKSLSSSLADIIWQQWGLPGDIPLPGDYTGDGKADLVVWRESLGMWFVCPSDQNFTCANPVSVQFGLPGDIPIRADFDGDATLDYAVWRPENGTWYWKQSSDSSIHQQQWGLPGDIPLTKQSAYQ
jgi:hypothetical protein